MMAAVMLATLVIAGIIVWCTPGSDAKDSDQPEDSQDIEDSDDEDGDSSDRNKCSCCSRRRRPYPFGNGPGDALQLTARSHVTGGDGVVNPVSSTADQNQIHAPSQRRRAKMGGGASARI